MDENDIGNRVILIISEKETIKGTITKVYSEFLFEITDDYGNSSDWNRLKVMGLKKKGDA